MKRDYPFETANYIIKHKVGASDGQYSLGHYSHWARSYIRQNNHALRRLLRLSGGYIEREENVKDGLILPLALTSDGKTRSLILPKMYHADHQNERSQVSYAARSRSNTESRFLGTPNMRMSLMQ